MTQDAQKRQAARAALDLLPESGIIGLGTGSTASHFIEALAERVAAGCPYQGVPTSDQSRLQAEALGIPLLDDAGPWRIDVCVDGADEVSAALDLIKGGGGCHAREKIVNQAAVKNVIVVDESKLSERIGQRFALPVEVLEFGWQSTAASLRRFGKVTLRHQDSAPWRTDSGNLILDIQTGPIESPAELDAQLRHLPGVVETGLFVRRADTVIVAGRTGVRVLVWRDLHAADRK